MDYNGFMSNRTQDPITIQEQNLATALRMGLINWLQYLEMFRKLGGL